MRRQNLFRAIRLLATLGILLGVAIVPAAGASKPVQPADPQPQPITHLHWNFYEGVLTEDADGKVGEAKYKNPPSPICDTSSSADNVNTDCEDIAPHNETSIAINPTDPDNMIGSLNDYQLKVSNGGQVNETAFSRAHVTLDGGQTWTTYPIYYRGYAATGDPGVAFDDTGTAYLSTLGFVWPQGRGLATSPDILVATSTDGGMTWSQPARVAKGTGIFTGIFNDKPYITAWGDGNAIVTWTVFIGGPRGSYLGSPIYATVTHDGGKSWSKPAEISGSADFCLGAQGGNDCNQSQGATPVVAADGSIYVSFLSTRELTYFADYYLVVKLNKDGQLVGGPHIAAEVVDGINDYPVSISGRMTYEDSQFRTWSLGNIAADPTDASHLAVIWSDMRNSPPLTSSNPYSVTTNSDVVVSQSFDGGVTWSAPVALTLGGDQFMPWAAYDASGLLQIGFFDRSYDPANHKYGYTLASETAGGTLNFSMTQVTTELSDPTRDTRWFAATVNPDYPFATTFLGDYGNIAASPTGVAAYWTDMRVPATFGARTGAGEDGFFALK
jgi:hypothetical protein